MANHPTAIIHETAQIHPTVEIGPNVVVEEEVVIGANCQIWQNTTLCKYTTLGENNKVHMNVVIGNEPQDLSFEGGRSFTRIGSGNTIREFTNIHRGTVVESATVIGNDNYFMAATHIAHNVQVGDNVITVNNACVGGYATVEDRVFLSANSMVNQFARIGKLSILTGGGRSLKDLPPFMILDESNLLGGLNVVGLRRAGFSVQTRKTLKQAYKILFQQGLNLKNAIEKVSEQIKDPEVDYLLNFLSNPSRRGVFSKSRMGNISDQSHSPKEAIAVHH